MAICLSYDPRYLGPVTFLLARKLAWPEQSRVSSAAMVMVVPSAVSTTTPVTTPSSTMGSVTRPWMSSAPLSTAASSSILSKVERRTCQVGWLWRPWSSRRLIGIHQSGLPLVPNTVTPCFTG